MKHLQTNRLLPPAAVPPRSAQPRVCNRTPKRVPTQDQLYLERDQLYLERDQLRERATELEALREHYTSLGDFAPVGYMVLDRSGLILELNDTGRNILGRSNKILLRWAFVGLVVPRDRRKFLNHLRLSSQQSAPLSTDLQVSIRGSGEPKWIEFISVCVSPEKNGLPYFKCAFSDITARKRAETALKESEKRFANLANAAPVMIWITDRDNRCTYVNQHWLDFTGRRLDEELHEGWRSNVHPVDRERRQKVYEEAVAHRREFKMEFRLRRHGGQYRWVFENAVPQFTEGAEFLGYIGSCVDITERKHMEEAFEAAGRLPEENPAPVVRLKRGRVISFWNPAAKEALPRWGGLGRLAPLKIRRAAVAAFERNEKQLMELAVGKRIFEVLLTPIPDADYVNLYFTDITARKGAESALRQAHRELEVRVRQRTRQLSRANASLRDEIVQRERMSISLRDSEERFRLMVEATQDYAIIMLDPKGRVVTWNAGARRIHDYRAKEIVGRHISRFYLPRDIRSSKPDQLLKIAATKGRVEDEGWRVRKDGSQFWASVVIAALRDEKGNLRGFCKIVRDITERRQAQEALRQTQENLSAFFEHSPLGLFWITPDGHIQRTNKTGADLLGCPEEAVNGRSISEFWVYADQAAQALKQLAGGGVLQDYRVRLRREAGDIRHVVVDANGLWERGRLLYSRWFVRDVTQLVELERAILGAIESERQRLGQDLHDDLCQQLTGIEFLSQSLAGQLRDGSKKQAASAQEIAAMIRDAITHTRELSRGLAPMTLESGGLQEALGELAYRSRKLYQIDCRFRQAKLGLNPSGTSAIHLYRIAQEAVSNAIKHGKAKRIDIGLIQNGSDLVLSVRDSGIGLPAKLPVRAGMGLRVMQHRAGMIGGTLTVHAGNRGGTSVVCSVRDYQLKSNQENGDETQKRAKR